MTRRAYLYFIVTILLGTVLGGAAVYYYLWHNGRLQHTETTASKVAHLKKALNLSDAQAQEIMQIFKDMEPRYKDMHKETYDRIRSVLSPDQQKQFDEHVWHINQRHKRGGSPPVGH